LDPEVSRSGLRVGYDGAEVLLVRSNIVERFAQQLILCHGEPRSRKDDLEQQTAGRQSASVGGILHDPPLSQSIAPVHGNSGRDKENDERAGDDDEYLTMLV
jgi:hypothetical protein